ncbi:MAG: hypothetical protein ABS46_16165 [Cytophagaceae bacterium SCN 52-12]|nr:MAG: hypothetical protein ABS46_16165 [Cytophagaceae bacterium SCN 52-12]
MALFGLLLIFNRAGAQVRSLQQVLEEADSNFPALKAYKADLEAAAYSVRSAKTAWLPSVSAQHQYTFSTGNNVDGSFFPNYGTAFAPSGGTGPVNIYQGVFGSFTSVTADWQFFNFGKVKAAVKAAESVSGEREAAYANALFQHQVRVADAYLALLVGQKITEVRSHIVDRTLTLKRVVDAAVRSGIKAPVDTALVNATVAGAGISLVDARRSVRFYQMRLAELTGTPYDSLRADSLRLFNLLPSTPERSRTAETHPLLLLSEAERNRLALQAASTQKSWLPSISLVGYGFARGSGNSNQDGTRYTDFAHGARYQVYNYLFGLSTRWNVTDIVRLRYNYKADLYQVEKAGYLLENMRLKLATEAKDADTQLDLSLQQARLTPVQLEAARRAYRQTRARYESGLTDLTTLTQSITLLNQAEIDHYVSTGNAWRSLLMKAAASGDLSLFLDQVQ